ncbi:MAG: TonB-dependent receptor plug domain-containing protein [Hydrotalea flava]|uniref:TonB-dependent receptor n=1 Tax=Hydrotalea sp. AMD TaxID=2501297 RepID=UPI0009446CBD|nr:TonB-dependent receptor [Hydrotalea sp. AMD]NIM34333.1 TonB-dependent receptor plug domain-containing protein [Hydrotalea flava]NIM37159.1 TonB-dependent receptor plug domain-containing protein [Hydrotalea flava]NIN02352.1 TonB-dependent receptor plug domain-containing protein [Hydrotalea flava]NIN14004.1 TonB-dependent receptor plug domain-containing protein [Hydrotalea flava]NIO93085.1 TonB-dependent receptor plug domain-containing protein [Hydrotalea flava]
MKKIILLLIPCFFFIAVVAQTVTIQGKVTGSKNEPLTGATITISGDMQMVIKTNVDGIFSFKAIPGKKYTLQIAYVGYQTKTITDVNAGSNTDQLSVHLMDAGNNLGDVTVKASSRTQAKVETINSAIQYQKNTAVVAQVLSAEAIKRTPDRNTGEVLKRIPGLSVIDGRYLVVRGLADRYNQAMLNGILLSSTEPDRKTFAFDIFPSNIIDNIIINKTFLPEYSGEWAGGLVQITTNDVPLKKFMEVQVGTGFNTQTIGHDFYNYKGGKLDFLGFDDGTRALPAGLPSKSVFNELTPEQKTTYGKLFENVWTANPQNNTLQLISKNFRVAGGFNTAMGNRNKLGCVFALNYNLTPRRIFFKNRIFSFSNNQASVNFDYSNNKYANDVLWGALGSLTLQLGNYNKLSWKNIFNVNTSDYTTGRTGKDFESNSTIGDNIRASELAFKANTYYNTNLSGEHFIPALKVKLDWFGSFAILDQYIPDQRRLQYNQEDPSIPSSPYALLISASKTSQRSGSRYYGFLNDYIYTTGANITKSLRWNNQLQNIKAGYFFQVKDRLFDSRPFAIYLPVDNPTLRLEDPSVVFSAQNFGNGTDNKFAFNEIYDIRYRYLANSILNAGFLQIDNQLLHNKLRIIWGARVENFDQLLGSVRKTDPRYLHTEKLDVLPGLNATYKLTNAVNLRLAGSQTVIRPEFRELSSFSFYDFDLGATITGNPNLPRTKVTNFDLRYEFYPKAGEILNVGVFYKYFQNPTELYFNNTGAGSSGTFNYISPDDAQSFGAEIEFRKRLDFTTALKNFTVQGNLSYIYNRVPSLGRPMQGQSPYLLNIGLQYDVPSIGLNTTLLFNQIGRRIYYVGGSDNPPVWEAPRPLLDMQIAKKVLKNRAEIKLNISDIINQEARFYHDLNDNKKYDAGIDALAIRKKYGTNVTLSFAYTILK